MPINENPKNGNRNGKFNKNVQDAEREFQEKMNQRTEKNSHMKDFSKEPDITPEKNIIESSRKEKPTEDYKTQRSSNDYDYQKSFESPKTENNYSHQYDSKYDDTRKPSYESKQDSNRQSNEQHTDGNRKSSYEPNRDDSSYSSREQKYDETRKSSQDTKYERENKHEDTNHHSDKRESDYNQQKESNRNPFESRKDNAGTTETQSKRMDPPPGERVSEPKPNPQRQEDYLNKNVKDAQREFDEKMHRRPGEQINDGYQEKRKEDHSDQKRSDENKGNSQRRNSEHEETPYRQETRRNNMDFKVPPMFRGTNERNMLNKTPGDFLPPSDGNALNLNDLSSFKGKSPTSIGHKIAKIERQFAMIGIHFGESTATQGSSAATGYQFSKEIGTAVAMTIINNTKVTLSNSMNYAIGRKMEQYYEMVSKIKNPRARNLAFIGRPRRVKDINQMIQSLNVLLKEQGYPPIKGHGKIGIINAMKVLTRHGRRMTPEMREVYKLIVKLFQNQTMMSGGGRFTALRRFGLQKLRRYAVQCDAGQGLVFTTTLIARAMNTLRMGWKFVKSTAKMAHLATLSAAKIAAWTAAKVAKTKLAQKMASKAKDVAVKHVSEGVRRAAKKTARATKRTGSRIGNLFRRARARYNQFRIDPFGIRGGTRRLIRAVGNRFWNSKFGRALGRPVRIVGRVFNPIRMLGNLIGRILVIISTIISTIISICFLIIGIIVLAALVVIIVVLIAESVIQWFDFSLNEEEIKQMALKQIKTCYEAQNKEIQGYYSQFRNVTVSYRDVKNESLYEKYKPEVAFTETTNSAELLCMAQVYFDFDLEDAGEYAVKDYIRQLYNGSHTTSIVKHEVVVKDEEGNETTYVDADITLTTYYFDSLFNCTLSNSYGTISGNETSEQVWNFFRTAGFSEEATAGIMGNLYQESGMDPTLLQNGVGPAAGICQMETYGNYDTSVSRWGIMAKKAEAKGKHWTDLQSQLEFMIDDMPEQFRLYTGKSPWYYDNGEWCWWPDKLTVNDYKALTDINLATEIFERVFERASKPNMQRRITAANDYYNTYKGTMPESETEESEEEPEATPGT